MKKFEKFYFEKFCFDTKSFTAKFYYSFDNSEEFIEEIDFSSELFELRESFDEKVLSNILFHIHIALGISYYKLYPTNELVVKS